MSNSKNKQDEARHHVGRLRGFYQNLTTYIIINIILIIVNLINDPHNLWFYWVSIFWGIAIVSQALRIFGPGGRYNREWEEKKIKEYLDKTNNKD